MSDKEMKKLWMDSSIQNEINLDLPLLINDFQEKMKNIDKEFQDKDIIEFTAGLIVIFFYGFKGITSNVLMSKLGFLLVALYGIFVIFSVMYLNQFKKTKMLRFSQIDYLSIQRNYLQKRVKMYNKVMHFVPLVVFNMMILYGTGIGTGIDIFILVLGFFILCTIYWKISISLKKESVKYLSILTDIEKIILHLNEDK